MKAGGDAVVFQLVPASRYVLSCYIAAASHCTTQKMKHVAFAKTLW
jgi:hypothetical protein